MIKRLSFGIGIVLGLLTIGVGCGGNGSVADFGTRGEGNVPIGRVKLPTANQVNVVATYTNGRTYSGSVSPEGTISMEPLPVGEMNLTIAPQSSDYATDTYPMKIGSQYRYIINANPVPKKVDAVVYSITLEVGNGKDLVAGKSYNIKAKVDGAKLANLKPTLWLDSDVASLDKNDKFVALSPGVATLHARLLGVETSIVVHVN